LLVRSIADDDAGKLLYTSYMQRRVIDSLSTQPD